MTRTTKILFILTGIILFLLVIYVIVSLFMDGGKTPPKPGRPATTLPVGGESDLLDLPRLDGVPDAPMAQAEAKLKQIIKEPIIGAALTKAEDKLIYYKRAGGNAFRADLNGEGEERISNLTILGISEALWNQDRSQALVTYADDRETKRFIHTVATGTASFLPKGVSSADWSPDGKTIAYAQITPVEMKVITMTPTGKNAKTVFTSFVPDWRVRWESSASLILATAPTFLIEGLANRVSLGGAAQPFDSIFGLEILPNAKTRTHLVTGTDAGGRIANAKLFDPKQTSFKSLDFKTLAAKCAWNAAGTALYCAAPRNEESGLPDRWYRGEARFRDLLVKYDVAKDKTTILLDSLFDAENLFTDSKEKFLFIEDKNDASLWRLAL